MVKKLLENRKSEQPDNLQSIKISKSTSSIKINRSYFNFDEKGFYRRKNMWNFLSLAALCISGTISPSILNFVYFGMFLITVLFISCNKALSRKFAIILRVISVMLIMHILMIFGYQNYYHLTIDMKLLLVILGLNRIVTFHDSDYFEFNNQINLELIIHPFVLILTYFVINCTTSHILVSQLKDYFEF